MQGKASIRKLFRSKAPKTQQFFHYRHGEKPVNFFLLFNTSLDFSLRNNFANSGSFAKVSIPVHIYNSLCTLTIFVGVVAHHYPRCINMVWFWWRSVTTPTNIARVLRLTTNQLLIIHRSVTTPTNIARVLRLTTNQLLILYLNVYIIPILLLEPLQVVVEELAPVTHCSRVIVGGP